MCPELIPETLYSIPTLLKFIHGTEQENYLRSGKYLSKCPFGIPRFCLLCPLLIMCVVHGMNEDGRSSKCENNMIVPICDNLSFSLIDNKSSITFLTFSLLCGWWWEYRVSIIIINFITPSFLLADPSPLPACIVVVVVIVS